MHSKFARNLGKLLAFAEQRSIHVLMYWLWRTPEEQHTMYLNGVSNCDGYETLSKHQLGCAADIAVLIDGKIDWKYRNEYEILGAYWETLGGTWGGRWKNPHDIYHFEM